jgi:hypothetical protein
MINFQISKNFVFLSVKVQDLIGLFMVNDKKVPYLAECIIFFRYYFFLNLLFIFKAGNSNAPFN